MMDFWSSLDELLESHKLVIDRPKGSRHPVNSGIVYPLDYGYLEGTSGGDGNEIDVWQGSEPGKTIVAIVCTVDSRKNDAEVKLLIGCTEGEIETVDRFHNDGKFMSAMIIKRDK